MDELKDTEYKILKSKYFSCKLKKKYFKIY